MKKIFATTVFILLFDSLSAVAQETIKLPCYGNYNPKQTCEISIGSRETGGRAISVFTKSGAIDKWSVIYHKGNFTSLEASRRGMEQPEINSEAPRVFEAENGYTCVGADHNAELPGSIQNSPFLCVQPPRLGNIKM